MTPKAHAIYWAMYDLAFGYHDRHAAFRQMVQAGIGWREAALEIRNWEHGGEHGHEGKPLNLIFDHAQ